MRIMIVEGDCAVARLWQDYLGREGFEVTSAETADQAVNALHGGNFDVVLINLVLPDGGAMGIADYIRVSAPQTQVIFVSDQTLFADGSLFALAPNLRMTIKLQMPPRDVAEIVRYCAQIPA